MGKTYQGRLLASVALWCVAGAAFAQVNSTPTNSITDNPRVSDVIDRLQAQVERVEAEAIAARQRADVAEKAAAAAQMRIEALEQRLATSNAFANAAGDTATAFTVAKPATAPVPSGDLPAVSGLNFKIDAAAGTSGGYAAFAGGQSVAIPLTHRLGLQIDAAEGFGEQSAYAGTAAQLFMRDPKVGLIGLYGSLMFNTHFGSSTIGGAATGQTLGRIGVTGAIYQGRFTVEGVAGYEGGKGYRDSGFDFIDIAYYPTDNLRLSIGHRYSDQRNTAAVGVEYQMPIDAPFGMSLFSNAQFGGKNDNSAMAGMRIYFGGEKKTLIRRHREDDQIGRAHV